MAPDDAPRVDDLVAHLRERVAERRREGFYPEGLEESLDLHFHHIAVRGVRDRLARLGAAIGEADAAGRALGADHIDTGSDRPGGELIHRTVARLVHRQVEGVLRQMREYADELSEVHRATHLALGDLTEKLDDVRATLAAADGLPGDTGALLSDLARRVEALEDARARQEVLAQRLALDPHEADALGRVAAARLGDRTGILAAGPPEFVGALAAAGLEPRSVDDPLVELAGEAAGSLPGAALFGAFERATPTEQFELVALLAQTVAPGGGVALAARHPQSLRGADPDAPALTHPAYVSFVLREAGFTDVAVAWPGEPGEPAEPGGSGRPADAAALAQAVFGARSYVVTGRRG